VEQALARVEGAVAAAVARHGLWSPGASVVAAVSGGADSLCLLGALLALRERGHPLAPDTIIVAHLDHGMRGTQAREDARWVGQLCQGLSVPCVAERLDVPALAKQQHRSLEDAARRARYAFLRRVAAEHGAERIVTGHTRDDQAETVALHWLRGSGLAGLAGMRPLAGDIARPLLAVSRAETEAYCAARGWQPRTDVTNADLRFRRNHLRRELLPLLERYNPALRASLARNAELIAADEDYLEAATDAAWSAVASTSTADTVALALDGMRALPAALRHRVARRAARVFAGPETALEARHMLALDALLEHGTSGDGIDLPWRLRVTRGYATLDWRRLPPGAAVAPAAAPGTLDPRALPVPGLVELPDMGWRVHAWLTGNAPGIMGKDAPAPTQAPALAHAGLLGQLGRAELTVFVDADRAGPALTVRAWRPGDRFRPLGMRDEKKVQDAFADAKVPRALRSCVPLVFGGEQLIWLGGLRIDDRVKITRDTRRVLALQLEPLEPLAATTGPAEAAAESAR
jgi:tRNA(Ile)-lysidine synthase